MLSTKEKELFQQYFIPHLVMRANYFVTKSLVPPTRFQNPIRNPDPRTLTLHLTLTNIVGGTRDLVGE